MAKKTTKKQSAKRSVKSSTGGEAPKVRYAVVGLGWFAQAAALPAFQHAKKNSRLTALISGDDNKLKKLCRKYDVEHAWSYEDYDEALRSGAFDAIYIALPNHLHAEYAIKAAEAGIHVLCEKPLAVTAQECQRIIDAAGRNGVKLMTAYRLHFEAANLKAIETVHSGKIGEIRIFNSLFTMNVDDEDNIRLQSEKGGGTLYDIGIYCINAARYIFRDEPVRVFAATASRGDERFSEVEEMCAATMWFPQDRLATFTCSFGASSVSSYQVLGTKGDLRVDPAYTFQGDLTHTLTINGRSREKVFESRDQIAPEFVSFSRCILENETPEPSGHEGMIDVRIIETMYESARKGRPVDLDLKPPQRRPSVEMEMKFPPLQEKPKVIKAESPK